MVREWSAADIGENVCKEMNDFVTVNDWGSNRGGKPR
jgi:hypothetical protein